MYTFHLKLCQIYSEYLYIFYVKHIYFTSTIPYRISPHGGRYQQSEVTIFYCDINANLFNLNLKLDVENEIIYANNCIKLISCIFSVSYNIK